MFSLPTLNQINAHQIIDELGEYRFWGVLLFPKSNQNIAQTLTKNWDLFSTSLGGRAHLVTLMEDLGEKTTRKLVFPKNYDQCVGRFCNSLGVRLGELPVIINLGNTMGRSTHYWSLARPTISESSNALVKLTDNIREATQKTPIDCSPAEWQSRVAARVSRACMLSAAQGTAIALSPKEIRPHLGELYASLKKLIR